MHLTEIRINLCPGGGASRLKAFCSLTFDNTFVVRDVKLIDGHDGLVRRHAFAQAFGSLPALHREEPPCGPSSAISAVIASIQTGSARINSNGIR